MERPDPKPDDSRELVLVVDDNSIVQETLLRLLETIGFNAEAVSSGHEALQVLEERPFTFLVTDMKMPEMDGMHLIKAARSRYPDLGIIAMTGYSEGYRYVDVINAGASDFIKKPFDIEELEAKIRRIINERTLLEELNRLSVTDSLTGLYNHRRFYNRLREEVVRAGRQGRNLAIILIDLDDFKAYNDEHGHLAGDEILRDVGNIIQKCIREGVDTGYRYGGDEFAVILIDADAEVASTIVDRLHKSFNEYGKIKASFGVELFDGKMTETELVDRADHALYENKQKNKKKAQADNV
ncbi:MAG: GGDEF domain-containing protein [Thermodesulfobacteriota bacterium]